MKKVAILLGWLMAVVATTAASKTSAIVTNRSSSGQYIVSGVLVTARSLMARSPSATNTVRLDPALLAVSSERIKQALLRELGARDRWRSRIYLVIQFTTATNQALGIQSSFQADGWRYRLDLPDEVEPVKLVRALTHVTLLEMANREAGERSAEIPLWLTEGLTQHLLATASLDLVLLPESRVVRETRKGDPLWAVRPRLRATAPLTFSQLSMPSPDTLSGEAWATYQASSQLLVYELLRLREGRAALQEMLRILPAHFNWQVAFLKAFQARFARILDVEKWWSLLVVNTRGYDQLQGWSRETSLEKLAEILQFPAQVRYATNDLPIRTELSLQKFVEHWDYDSQGDFLQAKLNQLQALGLHASPDVLPLLDAYRQVLETYLHKRVRVRAAAELRGQPAERSQWLVRETVQQLAVLEAQLEAERRRP
jgi:hypothetical protein